jgi:hypothetical protein
MTNQEDQIPYLKISRSLFRHFLWNEHRQFNRFEAWLDLIRKASFSEEVTELIKGKIVNKNKGQVIASIRFLMESWGWSKSKVSDFLEILRSQKMISIEKVNGISVITLLNYDKHSGKSQWKIHKSGQANGEESEGYEGEGDSEGTQTGTAGGQRGDSEGTNIIKDNKGKLIKKTTLSASFEAERKKEKEMKGKYVELVENLTSQNRTDTEVWIALKDFITNNKPVFAEPYVEAWNIFAKRYKMIDKPIKITSDRRDKLRKRTAEPDFDFFAILTAIKERPVMRGEGSGAWTVDFNYIIRSEKTYSEILEGKFK